MAVRFILFLALIVGLGGAYVFGTSRQDRANSSCAIVGDALRDAAKVKPGMTRSQVELYFVRAGGMSSRGQANYEYRRCRYLEITVDFSPDPSVPGGPSPSDKVTRVSRIFAAYPAKD
jgi:hypothetical protein